MSSLLLKDPPPLTKPANGALPFNKMFIMIPVMLAARNLKNDDLNTVYMIRIAYVVVQSICLLLAIYTYVLVSSIQVGTTTSSINRIIYVPAPPQVSCCIERGTTPKISCFPLLLFLTFIYFYFSMDCLASQQPFADPNTTKKKYTEVKLASHLLSQARSLLGSTLFGIAMTCALHYYKGMVMGLAIQAVMGPFNLWENVLVRTVLLRGTKVFSDPKLQQELRIFDEKLSIQELDASTDEAVDEQGNPIVIRNSTTNAIGNGTANTAATTSTIKTLEEVMLDTWDQGANASLVELLSMLNTTNINTSTKEDGWTSLMIVSGLKCENDVAAIRTMIQEQKADIMMTDNDGWTCLHWAAFHNSLSAATELYHHTALLTVTDNEGKTPLEVALAENNTGIIDLLQTVMNDTKKDK
jgi:Phosphate transport (Pho88)/Ankyrin repeats (3 copies)